VSVGMRGNWLLTGLAVGVVLVLAYAWYDGGREPVRAVAASVPVPESVR
jgi:hypothetical protein